MTTQDQLLLLKHLHAYISAEIQSEPGKLVAVDAIALRDCLSAILSGAPSFAVDLAGVNIRFYAAQYGHPLRLSSPTLSWHPSEPDSSAPVAPSCDGSESSATDPA